MVCRISFVVGALVGAIFLTGCGANVTDAKQTLKLKLREGQIARVPGTDLNIEVKKVRDFTSEGCLGGPVGCPDQVELEVTEGKESRQFILYVAQTPFQREQGVNQTNVFGYQITVSGVHGKQIALNIERRK